MTPVTETGEEEMAVPDRGHTYTRIIVIKQNKCFVLALSSFYRINH